MTSTELQETRDLNRALLEQLDRSRFETEFWKLSAEGAHESIEEVVRILKNAPREGAVKDDPEGARYIKISETLATVLIARLSGFNTHD